MKGARIETLAPDAGWRPWIFLEAIAGGPMIMARVRAAGRT
jgi:hypothetical protein